MKPVDMIPIRDNVAVVTIDKLPKKTDTLANVFCIIAQENINVDMISSLGDCTSEICVSFSTNESNITNLMRVLCKVRSIYSSAVTNINSGNVKLVLGGDMKSEAGVAARAFSQLAQSETEIRLITTSENEISLVISEADADTAQEALLEEFGGQE